MQKILPQESGDVAPPPHTVTRQVLAGGYDPAQVERFLHLLGHAEVGGITEIRILCEEPYLTIKGREQYVGSTIVGYYEPEHYAQAAQDIALYDGLANIYVTPNPVKRDLLPRAANRLKRKAKHTAKDEDILCRLWSLFDFDPARPVGISASEDELQAALARRDAVAADLEAQGAHVLRAQSGNGGHLLVRLPELPNDAESKRLVERTLQHYHELYSDDVVNVDTSVANASRIWKCYGTVATKGDSTPERPHRRAVLDFPEAPPVPFDLAALDIPEPEAAPEPARPTPTAKLRERQSYNGTSDSAPWVAGAVAKAVARVRNTPAGQKHVAVYDAAHNLAGFLDTGDITPEDIEHKLADALGGELDSDARRTIRDAIKEGQKKPHDIPEPTRSPDAGYTGHAETWDPQVLAGAPVMPKWELLSLADLFERPEPTWDIDRILPSGAVGWVTAGHATFKSTFALDAAMCRATGKPFHGRDVKQGRTVYVAAEGIAGIRQRARAWLLRHNLPAPEGGALAFIESAVQVGNAPMMEAFICQMEALDADFIIIDTQARCSAGMDENSTPDSTIFWNAIADLARRAGASVLVVHHNNKSGSYRGSSNAPASVDVHLSMERDGARVRMRCLKQKDGDEADAHMDFVSLVMDLGSLDEKGRPRTSIVLQATDAPVEPVVATSKADETREKILAILRDAPEGLRAKQWQEEVERQTGCKSSRFYDHRDALVAARLVEKEQSKYFAVDAITPITPITPIPQKSEQLEQEFHSDYSDDSLESEQSEYLPQNSESEYLPPSKPPSKRRGKNTDAEPYIAKSPSNSKPRKAVEL